MTNKAEVQGFSAAGFSAAVIGCGGLGCNIAVHLAGMGIGKLFLIDHDTVSPSNLNRQFLYSVDDLNEPKVHISANRLRRFSPDTEIIPVNRKIESAADLAFLRDTDIIFLAVDNNQAREIAQNFCTEADIPLVNGGINGFYGTAYLYVPHLCPCLHCAGLMEKESESVLSVSSTAGIIGALETELGITYLLRRNTHPDKIGFLHIYDGAQINQLKIKPQLNCEICGVKI